MTNQIKAYSYIRFSTPEQLKGDSLRRQLEASEKYAKDNGLDLDRTINFQDLGLSAYHGKHRTKGALRDFLECIDNGKIANGSILIVENLDRLSREDVFDALNQFTSIINAGISIVTLQDGMKYSKESIKENWTKLIISITCMARANDESERKSQRNSAVWAYKREKAIKGDLKLTSRAPAWLKLSDDKKTFLPINEAVEAIESIFNLKLCGFGLRKIAKELNQKKGIWKPPENIRRSTSGWTESYIQAILTNGAVLGNFTMLKRHKEENRIIIPNYFPAIINKDLYNRVASLMKSYGENKGNTGGKVGRGINLFSNIIFCGFCKTPMHSSMSGKKHTMYLQCASTRRGEGCNAKHIRYDEFERLFFENFEELNVSDLIPDQNSVMKEIRKLKNKIIAEQQHLSILSQEIENYTNAIGKTNDDRVLMLLDKKLIVSIDEKDQVQNSIQTINKELDHLLNESQQMQENIDTAKEVFKLFSQCKNEEEEIRLRLRLRMEIRKLISSIYIYPLKEEYQETEVIEEGLVRVMRSRYIDHVRIHFKGSKNKRVLYLKTHAEQFA